MSFALIFVGLSFTASFACANEGRATQVGRLIVGFHGEGGITSTAAGPADRAQALGVRTGQRWRGVRAISPTMAVIDLGASQSGAALERTMAAISADPFVAFVEPDARAYRHAVPNDSGFASQWYLQATEISAIRATTAWDLTTGSNGVVVAVLDTGVRGDHPDLGLAGRGGRLLPGYDFVGADPGGGSRTANDGDGRDPNPADPGDWVSVEDASGFFGGCLVEPSSWHGTRVSGMIGAITNNIDGIAGGTWQTWILPVRVLGKCGGYNSDIVEGMRWAGGLSVSGIPDNPYPARVLNMSLGASGNCTASYQAVVNELAAAGVLVVASAGNSNGGSVEVPGNCNGALAVAGLRHIGTKVGFSSIGSQVGIAAPGGNCVNTAPGAPCLFSLDTTTNTGETTAIASVYTNQLDFNVGTSFSAPQVAAAAGLMLAVNYNLTPAQLRARMRESARPFPAPAPPYQNCPTVVDATFECGCTTTTCGAGMLDAAASVSSALRPIAAADPPATVTSGQPVVIAGTGSAAACTRTIASYAWSVQSGTATLAGANTATVTVNNAPTPGSTVVVRLTITDDEGAQDTVDVNIQSSSATTNGPETAGNQACPAAIVPTDPGPFVDDGPTATSGGGGGGGGGATGLVGLACLAFIAWARRRSH
jgi:serine protease